MIIEDVNSLNEKLKSKSIKVCIIDNNSVDFLSRLDNTISVEMIFKNYDLVLIPGWVKVEIEDSRIRKEYIERLALIEKVSFYYISEFEYLEMIRYRDADLFNLFLYSCYSVKPLESFIKRNIQRGRPIEELEEYNIWLTILYNDGFSGEGLLNGRQRKKNAGEISICVLSLILSYFYIDNIDNITIFTNDRDAYDFNKNAINQMQHDKHYRNIRNRSITFKSNDFLICEFYKMGLILQEDVGNIHRLRNERWISFTRKKHDNSIEEGYKLIKNDEFIEMIKDSSLYIIF